MKLNSLKPLALAVVCLSLAAPALAQMGSVDGQQDQGAAQTTDPQTLRGEHEAMRMVPTRAVLKMPLNADKTSQGSTFTAVLASKTQLANGPVLPSGTILMGTVTDDDMNLAGASKLALRFTMAQLKNGTTVPIKATIVGIERPESTDVQGNPVTPGDQVPNTWNDGTLAVDQINVVKGVDLHSRIASHNSGVLVSNTRSNVKLAAGSELALAIAAAPSQQAALQ